VSEAKQRAILQQITMRAELDGALAWMGGLIDVVSGVVFDGIDVTAWSEARSMHPKVGLVWLVAALDRLCEFYEPEDRRPVTARIRAVVVVGGGQ
jgi:hypothetical protein